MENPYDLTPPKYQEPPRARTIRRAARAALKGHWSRMVLVMLVFLLLTTPFVSVSVDTEYDYTRVVDGYPSLEALTTVEFGPLGRAYREPIDLTAQENYRLSFGESTAIVYRAGWAAIPQAIQAVILAAGVLTFLIALFGPVLQLGLYESFSSLYRGEHPRVSQLFSKVRFFGKALWLGILEAFFIFLWALLLIVPGIIAAYRYAMAFYILRNNPEMRAIDALRESKRRMDGNKGRLFCLQLSYIGWNFLVVAAIAAPLVAFDLVSITSPHLLLLWPFRRAFEWAGLLIGTAFLMSYEYVGEFEFFKELEASWNGEPV